jgi:hypothetical protein
MIIKSSLTGAFHKGVNLKSCLWLGLITGVCFATPISSLAGLSFVGDGYAILDANGGGNIFYAVDSYNSPTFKGNILTIQYGQSLTLGGEVQTYPSGGGTDPGRASSAFIGYQIVGTGISGQINLPWFQNTGSNDKWQKLASGSGVNLDQSLSAGTYTLQVWFGGVSNDGSGTVYDNNGGINYSATFTVTAVPEPVTLALPIFGGLVAIAGLSRRFFFRFPAA